MRGKKVDLANLQYLKTIIVSASGIDFNQQRTLSNAIYRIQLDEYARKCVGLPQISNILAGIVMNLKVAGEGYPIQIYIDYHRTEMWIRGFGPQGVFTEWRRIPLQSETLKKADVIEIVQEELAKAQ